MGRGIGINRFDLRKLYLPKFKVKDIVNLETSYSIDFNCIFSKSNQGFQEALLLYAYHTYRRIIVLAS